MKRKSTKCHTHVTSALHHPCPKRSRGRRDLGLDQFLASRTRRTYQSTTTLDWLRSRHQAQQLPVLAIATA